MQLKKTTTRFNYDLGNPCINAVLTVRYRNNSEYKGCPENCFGLLETFLKGKLQRVRVIAED